MDLRPGVRVEEFEGCCLDCERSLRILKPHILRFYEEIKGLPLHRLEDLGIDELLGHYQLLDDIAHLPIGDRLAQMILEDPEIKPHLPPIREYYKAFLILSERQLAKRVCTSRNPWGEIEAFPLFPRYEALLEAYLREIPTHEGMSLAFLGSGPVPFTLLLAARLGIRGIGFDSDSEAVRLSEEVIAKVGLQEMIRVVWGDETSLMKYRWDALLVAALAEPKARIFRELLRIYKSDPSRTSLPICYRTYTGMRAILYEPVREEDLKGFRKIKEIRPEGRVNNTLVFVTAGDETAGGQRETP